MENLTPYVNNRCGASELKANPKQETLTGLLDTTQFIDEKLNQIKNRLFNITNKIILFERESIPVGKKELPVNVTSFVENCKRIQCSTLDEITEIEEMLSYLENRL